MTKRIPKDEQIERLQGMVERMATTHIEFYVRGNPEPMHVDWCPLCRLEKAEQIGSPKAIAEWVEEVVVPIMGVKGNIPEVSMAKGVWRVGFSAGDLLEAIRESEVLLGD